MMRQYSKYIDVITNTPGVDAVRGALPSWSVTGQLWASIENQTSNRSRLDGPFRNNQNATIYISQRPTLTTIDRLRYNGEVYRIQSMFYDEGNDELVCDCLRIAMDDTDTVS